MMIVIYIPLCYLLNFISKETKKFQKDLHSTMLSIKSWLRLEQIWNTKIYIPLCYLLNSAAEKGKDSVNKFTFHYVIY